MRTHWTRMLHVDLLAPSPTCAEGPVAAATRAKDRTMDELVSAVASCGHAMVSTLARLWDGYARRRRMRLMREELQSLDDYVLRDLAIHRTEIDSVVAELTGRAVNTRRRAPFALERMWPSEPL